MRAEATRSKNEASRGGEIGRRARLRKLFLRLSRHCLKCHRIKFASRFQVGYTRKSRLAKGREKAPRSSTNSSTKKIALPPAASCAVPRMSIRPCAGLSERHHGQTWRTAPPLRSPFMVARHGSKHLVSAFFTALAHVRFGFFFATRSLGFFFDEAGRFISAASPKSSEGCFSASSFHLMRSCL